MPNHDIELDFAALESADEVADDFLALPPGAQLGVLRTVVPRALGSLDGPAREGFWRKLRDEIDRFTVGEESYDLREHAPSREHHGRRDASLREFLSAVAGKLPNAPEPTELLDQVVAVLSVLGARITDGEFQNLLSQVPRNLRDILEEEPPEVSSPRRLDAAAFVARVAGEATGGDTDAAFQLCAAVCRTLTERFGNAAIKARRQLPIDFLPLFAEPPERG